MQIIDLSQSLYDHMPVYLGDPEVKIEQIHHLDKEGWHLSYLQTSSHIDTHADAFAHMDKYRQHSDQSIHRNDSNSYIQK
ncbi:MAG: cyclase family protein [bacterium]